MLGHGSEGYRIYAESLSEDSPILGRKSLTTRFLLLPVMGECEGGRYNDCIVTTLHRDAMHASPVSYTHLDVYKRQVL